MGTLRLSSILLPVVPVMSLAQHVCPTGTRHARPVQAVLNLAVENAPDYLDTILYLMTVMILDLMLVLVCNVMRPELFVSMQTLVIPAKMEHFQFKTVFVDFVKPRSFIALPKAHA